MPTFEPGATAVRRDVLRGKVWSAHAVRVLADSPDALVACCRPGAECLAPTTWIEWLLTGDDGVRKRALPNLAAGRWRLDRWIWRDTVQLLWNPPGTWFSVHAFYDASDEHRLSRWYVNFQRPLRRTALGFDTFDLLLDLVVAPDLSGWSWKDEGEYAQGRRLGVVGEDDHRAVERARDQAVAMIENRDGPFAPDAGWAGWRSDPSWPATALPADVLTADVLTADVLTADLPPEG
ncbi:DUF402 domain-containing protein [Saccharothrix hoggarensis]|uniref:DUF402 domain-containing protein n=1 Tax=Saccharothrix hoggarensis TaxID=913853 RepID=A0ABW3QRN6_9PSEU